MDSLDSSKQTGVREIMILFAVCVIGGMLVSVGGFIVSQLINLLIVTPFIMGVLGGFILKKPITKYKLRKPVLGMVFGLIMGLVIYGVFNYANYIRFRWEA